MEGPEPGPVSTHQEIAAEFAALVAVTVSCWLLGDVTRSSLFPPCPSPHRHCAVFLSYRGGCLIYVCL